ncbi:MAG TPA: MBL fold metallo-hydrolase, partial [Alphaproteobacteria bacterium]
GLYDPVITPIAFKNDQYNNPVTIAGMTVIPFVQQHGVAGRSLGYRFGDFAYSTDVSGLDDAAFKTLEGVKTWIVDCAQFDTEFVVVHPNFQVVKEWNERVGAERVILTHMTPRVDYDVMRSKVPAGYEPAYDGLVLEFTS